MSSTWASVVPAGKVPKDYCPAISTASLPVLARRFRADPHEVGRIEGIGLDSLELVTPERRRPGPASAASRSSLQKIVGAIVGRRLELGANTYRVLVPPNPPQTGFGATSTFGSRADPRERGPPCAGGHGRLAEAGACRSS